MSARSGQAWVFGDEVNTDLMAPGLYMKAANEVMVRHCLEALDPRFASEVRPGDIVVGGHNWGVGSAREQAALNFAMLGVGAILAGSFARIFYRNALNFGVPCLFFPAHAQIARGDRLCVDAVAGTVENLTSGRRYAVDPIPPHLMQMVADGGLIPHLKRRFASASRSG